MKFRSLLGLAGYLCLLLLCVVTAMTPFNALALASSFTGGTNGLMLATTPGLVGFPSHLLTGELLKRFRTQGGWVNAIPRRDEFVGSNVIHFTNIGGDPTVLINNTTYPIAAAVRDDADIAITLDKLDTTNTIVTDDEMYGITYDKLGSVIDQHNDKLQEEARQLGLHNLCVNGNTSTTPVLVTTGAESLLNPGFKALRLVDIATLKARADSLRVPKAGRVLVLNSTHVNELLMDQLENGTNVFRDLYVNTKTGEAIDFYGFTIYEDTYSVMFNAAGTKKAYGAAAASGDRPASVFVIAERAFQANGTAKFYLREAKDDPEMRQNRAGFRLYTKMMPKLNTGFGAVISAPTA